LIPTRPVHVEELDDERGVGLTPDVAAWEDPALEKREQRDGGPAAVEQKLHIDRLPEIPGDLGGTSR
jgi:hypothetical protein